MSWAAHELESYILHKHVKTKVSYLAILLGCLLPDMLTKLPVYGISIGSFSFKPDVAWMYHRGWPGVGFTHSLMFALVPGLLVLLVFKSREWALGLVIGTAAHVLTDVFDSVGTMLFFPFTTQHYSTQMWAYAAQEGRYGDAAAYYTGLGLVWDLFWLVLVLCHFSSLRSSYFFEKVATSDPVWGWLRRRLHMPDRLLLALYRAYFIYGACRIFGWSLWNQVHEKAPYDLTWNGPDWVVKATVPGVPFSEFARSTAVGALGLFVTCWVLWLLIGRRLWLRAIPVELPADGASPEPEPDADDADEPAIPAQRPAPATDSAASGSAASQEPPSKL
jgi:membrane-bound metal-dependent hydrolase YbcI (DUF457 family)